MTEYQRTELKVTGSIISHWSPVFFNPPPQKKKKLFIWDERNPHILGFILTVYGVSQVYTWDAIYKRIYLRCTLTCRLVKASLVLNNCLFGALMLTVYDVSQVNWVYTCETPYTSIFIHTVQGLMVTIQLQWNRVYKQFQLYYHIKVELKYTPECLPPTTCMYCNSNVYLKYNGFGDKSHTKSSQGPWLSGYCSRHTDCKNECNHTENCTH